MAEAAGASVETIDVAGAFELPAALRMAIQAGRTGDGVLILGCVVQGGTDHYEHICRETFRGVMDISVQTGCAGLRAADGGDAGAGAGALGR